MTYAAFVNEVQKYAPFASRAGAESAIRATVQTFGERLSAGEAIELAGHLPEEVGVHLLLNLELPSEPPGVTAFFNRIAEREGVDIGLAVCHARAVIEVLQKVFWDEKPLGRRDPLVTDITPLFENAVMGQQALASSRRYGRAFT